MSEQKIYDIAIVGGGAGGCAAAVYAMRAMMDTVIFERAVMGGSIMNSNTVENWPGIKSTTGAEFAMLLSEHVAEYKPAIISSRVKEISPGEKYHTLVTEDGNETKAHAVILATGGSPKFLNASGEFPYVGKGVSYCATCDGFFFRDKTVTVIGGGDTAAEEALYLAKMCAKVYMIHRRDQLRASKILQQHVLENPKIEMVWDTVVEEIKGDGNEVKSIAVKNVKTDVTKEFLTDGVFIFVGFSPNNDIVPDGIEMNHEGYVMTDYKCATALCGIFAIGDLKHNFARQLVIAAGDGATAALAATAYVENLKTTF